jgi:hypothetical protein
VNPFLPSDVAPDSHEWARRANCKGKAVELFEYQEKDSPLTKDMKFKERLAFNYQNFELAAEICIECPVMFECLNSATDEDRYWTVRGGEPPKRFDIEADQLARTGRSTGPAKPKEPRTCKRGHYVPNGGRCMACKRHTNGILQKKTRAAAKAARVEGSDAVS